MDTLSGLHNEAHTGICCAHQQKAEPQDTSSTSLPSSGMVVCAYPAGLGENNTGSSCLTVLSHNSDVTIPGL